MKKFVLLMLLLSGCETIPESVSVGVQSPIDRVRADSVVVTAEATFRIKK